MEDLDLELVFAVMSGKVSNAINRRMNRDFREAGVSISPEQWTVLLYLWQQDGVTQREIADATYKDKPSITRLIDNLEKQGFLTRTQDREDRRMNKIYLTERGISIREDIRKITMKTMQTALGDLSKKEIDEAQILLRKVFHNVRVD